MIHSGASIHGMRNVRCLKFRGGRSRRGDANRLTANSPGGKRSGFFLGDGWRAVQASGPASSRTLMRVYGLVPKVYASRLSVKRVSNAELRWGKPRSTGRLPREERPSNSREFRRCDSTRGAQTDLNV